MFCTADLRFTTATACVLASCTRCTSEAPRVLRYAGSLNRGPAQEDTEAR